MVYFMPKINEIIHYKNKAGLTDHQRDYQAVVLIIYACYSGQHKENAALKLTYG